MTGNSRKSSFDTLASQATQDERINSEPFALSSPQRGRIEGRILAFALALAACHQSGVQNVPPAIQLQTSSGAALKSLVFSATAFGATSTQTFQVASVGTVDAHVTLAFSGPEAALFTVSPAATSQLTVPAGSKQAFTVTFAPLLPSPIPQGNVLDSATLTLTSDDPNNATVPIPVSGTAAAQQLDLCWAQTPSTQECLSQGPVTAQFGTIKYDGDGGVQEIDVVNRSDVPLTLTSIGLDATAAAAGFSIVEQVSTPLVLSAAAGESLVMHVALTPKQGGTLGGNFQVTSDDPRLGGKPEQVALAATGLPPVAPTACLGIYEIDYATGQTAAAPQLNPAEPLSAQPSVVPPGPLDKAYFTGEPSATCSDDPQDGQKLVYQFTLATPPGSTAALIEVSGHPEEQTLLFDLPGLYTVTLLVTDSAGLTATTQLPVLVKPHDDISVQLSWQSVVPVDLDLHFVRVAQPDAGVDPLDELNVPTNPTNDCYYADCLPKADYGNQTPIPYVDWNGSTTGIWSPGDPLLEAQWGYAPLNSEPLDAVVLSDPQAGADYDLFVLYYQPSAGEPAADGGSVACTTSAECTDPDYPACVLNECVPAASAVLRTFVEGQELDAGSPLTLQLAETCNLWWAGTLHWIASGVQLPDGGETLPEFTFTPTAADAGSFLTSGGTPGPAGCVP